MKSQRPASMDQILGVVSKHSFAVIGLSVSRTNELGTLARAVAKIRRHSKNSAIGVMVGGPALCGKPEMAATVGADAMASNGLLAVIAAQKLFDRRHEVAAGTNDDAHAGASPPKTLIEAPLSPILARVFGARRLCTPMRAP